MNVFENRQQIATSYNQLVQQGYFGERLGGNEAYLGCLMTTMIPYDATSFLEVGGATGLWAEQMLREHPNIQEITAVEISDAAQVYKARMRSAKANLKLNVIQADFLQVAQNLKAADVVASSFAAQYMGNPSDYIRKLYELTRPNGRVIFVDVMSQPNAALGEVSGKATLEAFALVSLAYWQENSPLPLLGFLRSANLTKLYQESAFLGLSDYHESYHFPLEAWKAEQAKYPNAKFYNLGLAGLLVLTKPSH
jgi:ubiquinone/menaquinone biosynthesis C-methylase UbiE